MTTTTPMVQEWMKVLSPLKSVFCPIQEARPTKVEGENTGTVDRALYPSGEGGSGPAVLAEDLGFHDDIAQMTIRA